MSQQQRTYTTAEVQALTGLTLRTLQYWVDNGIVEVQIRGRVRYWPEASLRKTHWIGTLRRNGVPLQRAVRIAAKNGSYTELGKVEQALDLLRKVGLR